LTRTLGFGVALSVAFQAAISGTAAGICRHTTEEMTCDCPHLRESAPDLSTLRAESCCQIRTVTAETAPAVVKATAPSVSKQSIEVWSAPERFQALPREDAGRRYVAPRRQVLASTPLYLSIRSLLI